jgi:hypothetical protein
MRDSPPRLPARQIYCAAARVSPAARNAGRENASAWVAFRGYAAEIGGLERSPTPDILPPVRMPVNQVGSALAFSPAAHHVPYRHAPAPEGVTTWYRPPLTLG